MTEDVLEDDVSEEIETVEEAEEPEGEEIEARAREMGWRPKGEWKGPEEGWRDAAEFVERGEKIAPIRAANAERKAKELEERLDRERREFDDRVKRIEASNEAALDRQRKHFKAEQTRLDAAMDAAAKDADYEGYKRLKAQRDGLSAPETPPPKDDIPPEVREWGMKNRWFYSDPVAQAAAKAEAGRVAKEGGDVSAQLAAAEDVVRKRFPELFPEPVERVVDSPKAAPPARVTRRKGAAELPEEARSAGAKFIRQGIYKDMAEYAADYWREA